MARPISWNGRLREIHRLVDESPRTPYHRADLEKLFRVKPRAAQMLIEVMARQNVGSSTVVEREDLLEFLGGCLDAEDLAAHLAKLRTAPPKPKRKKLRMFVPRDFQPGNLRTIDLRIRMRRGTIELNFDTLAELASQLLQLSTVIELPEFERRFCRPPEASVDDAKAMMEVEQMFAELEGMEVARGIRKDTPADTSAREPSEAPPDARTQEEVQNPSLSASLSAH